MAYATNTTYWCRQASLFVTLAASSWRITGSMRSQERMPDGLTWREWLGAGALWLTAVLFFTTFFTNT